jgi:hypothetical protein
MSIRMVPAYLRTKALGSLTRLHSTLYDSMMSGERVLFLLIAVVPILVEAAVYYYGIWWHSDKPKDPRNGL